MPKKPFISRRKFLALTGGSVAAAAVGGASAYHQAGQLEVRHIKLTSPHGAPDFKLKISLLSDLHWRHWASPDELLTEAVRQSNLYQPDLVLLAGDFICHRRDELPPLLPYLQGLQATIGKYAVAGNHDRRRFRAQELATQLQTADVALLCNSSVQLHTPASQAFYLSGLDSACNGYPDTAKALAGLQAHVPHIMMLHEPDYWDDVLQQAGQQQLPAPDLVLSGHTHGGQCRIPYVDWTPVTVRLGRKYVRGHFSNGTRQLYVSSGLGTTTLPIRFACPPEICCIEFSAAPAQAPA